MYMLNIHNTIKMEIKELTKTLYSKANIDDLGLLKKLS